MFPEVLKFALELYLGDGGGSLCCEGEAEAGLATFFDDLVDDAGLACAGGRSDEDWAQLINEPLDYCAIAVGLLGRHKDL